MFTKITEIALLIVFLGLMLVLWPSAASYPLPSEFTTTIANIAGKAKMLQELPILDKLFWWLLFYIRLFILYYTFKFVFMLLRLITGKDRSLKA